MKEDALFPLVDEPTQIFRLTVLPAFTDSMVVRIENTGDAITLTAKRTSGPTGAMSLENSIELTQPQWETLQGKLSGVDFWNLPTRNDVIGKDGSEWILEGVDDGRYHVVDRWVPDPDSGYGALGQHILSLAGFSFRHY